MRPKLKMALVGAIAAAPAFVAYAIFILNHFYRYGAVLLDTGLLADLAWHKAATLQPSPLFGGLSFYAYHVTPIFAVLSALSWLAPLSMAQWFALFTGFAHALLAVAVFWLLTVEYGLRTGWRLFAAAGFAIAFSFNGLAIAQARYPHFEILIASSLILFLVALWRRRFVLAAVFFGLALICREDAGFHAFAVLAVFVSMRRLGGERLLGQKPALIFLASGFIYSAAAVLLSETLFPGHSSFVRVYLGNPPLAHVTWSLVALRFAILAAGRSYIFLPMVCAVAWAIVARNPYLLVGYVAFIPWTMLHLLARSDEAGMLSSYYGFPYLIAAFWPLIGWLVGRGRAERPWWEPYVGFGAMVLASFTALSAQHNPSRIPLWAGFTDPPTLAQQANVERAMAALHADHALLGRLLAGESVVSLKPDEFRRDEIPWGGLTGRRDSLAYFAGSSDVPAMTTVADRSGVLHAYAVSGTPLRIVTNKRSADLPNLGVLLKPLSQ